MLSDNAAGRAPVAYFPLQSLALQINRSGAALLNKLKRGTVRDLGKSSRPFLERLAGFGLVNGKGDRQPAAPSPPAPGMTATVLLLSDICTLRCLYCYRKAEGHGDMMPFEIAKAAIDTVIENATASRNKGVQVGFHGGGEPTLNFNVLMKTIDYARRACRARKLPLHSSICTNGIIDEHQAQWLAYHVDAIVVSIDGPPDIHNRQRPFSNGRPSFEKVAATIDTLRKVNKRYTFRTTITGYSENRMDEVYDFLVRRFMPKAIGFEPLFVCGRCESTGCRAPSKSSFANEFLKVLDSSKVRGLPVHYSGGRLQLQDRFCGAAGSNFFVTPAGLVTSCLEVSTAEDPRARMFIYGHYDKSRRNFIFDRERLGALSAMSAQSLQSCATCFARWHCCGDCPAKVLDINSTNRRKNPYRCFVNKRIIKHLVMTEVDKAMKSVTNATLKKKERLCEKEGAGREFP